MPLDGFDDHFVPVGAKRVTAEGHTGDRRVHHALDDDGQQGGLGVGSLQVHRTEVAAHGFGPGAFPALLDAAENLALAVHLQEAPVLAGEALARQVFARGRGPNGDPLPDVQPTGGFDNLLPQTVGPAFSGEKMPMRFGYDRHGFGDSKPFARCPGQRSEFASYDLGIQRLRVFEPDNKNHPASSHGNG